MPSSAEKANLARIRDNQRRSRARRKEYLEELERRLRRCQVQGIQASSEIQQAAQKVVDENRKLRILLDQHGICKDDVDAFSLSTSNLESNAMSGVTVYMDGFGGYRDCNAEQMLEQLLNTKRCIPVNTWVPERSSPGYWNRDSFAANASALLPEWEQPSHSRTCIAQELFPLPNSSVDLASLTSPGSQMQICANSSTQNINASINMPLQSQETFDIQPISMLRPHIFNSQMHFRPQAPYPATQLAEHPAKGYVITHILTQRLPSSQYVPTSTMNSTCASSTLGQGPIEMINCVFVAETISSLTGRDEIDVLTDLGCAPYSGAECGVDIQIVYSVLGRYVGQNMGL